MSLSSASTDAEVWAAYDDNCSYDLNGSVTECKAFIQACRILLRRMAQAVEQGDNRVQDDYAKIENQLNEAVEWWQSNDTDAATSRRARRIVHADLSDFRE